MTKQLEEAIKGVTAALDGLDPVDAKYLLRYVGLRLDQADDDIVAAYLADRADREMAERIDAHRREKVLGDAADVLGVSVDALVSGTEASGKANKAGKGN